MLLMLQRLICSFDLNDETLISAFSGHRVLRLIFFLQIDILMWSAGKISSENPKDMSFKWLLCELHPGIHVEV